MIKLARVNFEQNVLSCYIMPLKTACFQCLRPDIFAAPPIRLVLSEPHSQGCHWSRKSRRNSSGKSQGILEFVREILNLVESQGNSRKVREI